MKFEKSVIQKNNEDLFRKICYKKAKQTLRKFLFRVITRNHLRIKVEYYFDHFNVYLGDIDYEEIFRLVLNDMDRKNVSKGFKFYGNLIIGEDSFILDIEIVLV